jgi:hypothetical protein
MSTTRAAARRKAPRLTAADRRLAEHLAKNSDKALLETRGYGLRIVDSEGYNVASIADLHLRAAINMAKMWTLENGCEVQLVLPAAGKAVN